MLNILEKLCGYASEVPRRTAIQNGTASLTYRELWDYSDALASYLLSEYPENRDPIAVYGHKDPWMLVCFLACVKSGRAYCPIDRSVPQARVELILDALPSQVVLSTEQLPSQVREKKVLELVKIQELCGVLGTEAPQSKQYGGTGDCAAADAGDAVSCSRKTVSASDWVRGSDTWYIIFTSGSTGAPKGVQISADCLAHYLDWSVTLGGPAEEKLGWTFLNQAPFSFDLSVMDLYTSLASGGTLYCLDKEVQSEYRLLLQSLRESGAQVWVSTPSFAEICLSDRSFAQELMPELRLFLFCGETLANRTVQKLQSRFPNAKILNTYGPTESTVAVTEVCVTPELAEQVNPLPVGAAKPGTRLEIWDENGRSLPDGEKGEIIILGDTVSTGYYRQAELTQKAFFTLPESGGVRGYHTGDEGCLKDGMLYYCGRIDLQVKLHGYRIELGDIENNLRKLPGVEHAVVLASMRDGKVKSLTACVVEQQMPEDEKAETQRLKQELLAYVPDYMVPKKFVFLEQMPMTDNGKADRKRLGGLLR